ncbi:MAG: thioredoxin-disulfide reductase [Chloroflexi bacterium]|nr:thioredoxin-disulfide reductase [Chloroflexota bacterium]
MKADYDVVVIGGGAAGLSAALYAVRAKLKTVVLERFACGGQILNTAEIENYPGFPEGILGPDLSSLLEKQVTRFGAEVVLDEVEGIQIEGDIRVVKALENTYRTKTIIIASGGEHNKLGVPGEEEFAGRGVSYCATCDGNFFADQDVVVVGGGDAAIDEGLYLSRITKKVTVVHRRDQLRASKILQERAFSNPKMDFKWSHTVEEVRGNGQVDRVLLKNLRTGERTEFGTYGVFIYIGFHPNSAFLRDVVPLDNGGHVQANIRMETSIPGVYACGDVRQYSDRQLATAVGDGVTAALSAYNYITE